MFGSSGPAFGILAKNILQVQLFQVGSIVTELGEGLIQNLNQADESNVQKHLKNHLEPKMMLLIVHV